MLAAVEKITRAEEDGFSLFVRLTPKAARDTAQGISEQAGGHFSLNIHIRAVPEDGKANKALLKFLAKQLKLPLSALELSRGQTSRYKQLRLRGDKTELREKLAKLCAEEK